MFICFIGWVGQNRCTYTMYDRIFGDFPANNTAHTPCIPTWFWPTLFIGITYN